MLFLFYVLFFYEILFYKLFYLLSLKNNLRHTLFAVIVYFKIIIFSMVKLAKIINRVIDYYFFTYMKKILLFNIVSIQIQSYTTTSFISNLCFNTYLALMYFQYQSNH